MNFLNQNKESDFAVKYLSSGSRRHNHLCIFIFRTLNCYFVFLLVCIRNPKHLMGSESYPRKCLKQGLLSVCTTIPKFPPQANFSMD